MHGSLKDTLIGPFNSEDHFWGYVIIACVFCRYTLPALFKAAVSCYKIYSDYRSKKLRVEAKLNSKAYGMLSKAKKQLNH